MTQIARVSPEFKAAFDKVCAFYDFDHDDIEDAKAAVRRDYDNAKVCYMAIAADIDAELEKV
jgi:hypothetical protein